MLLDDERVEMVNAVNRFNETCELEQRCEADSHIALHELFEAPDFLEQLSERYRRMLAGI